MQALAGGGQLVAAHRPQPQRYAMRYHCDPGRIDAEQFFGVARGVVRNRNHPVCAPKRAGYHPSRAQRLALRKPARVAVDREVVDRDHRRRADIHDRQRAGGAEENVGPQAAQPRRPLHVATDEWERRQPAIGNRARCLGRNPIGNENRESAVRPFHAHRSKDLGRVDADTGPWPGEPDAIYREVETRQPVSAGMTGCASAPRNAPGRVQCLARPRSGARRR